MRRRRAAPSASVDTCCRFILSLSLSLSLPEVYSRCTIRDLQTINLVYKTQFSGGRSCAAPRCTGWLAGWLHESASYSSCTASERPSCSAERQRNEVSAGETDEEHPTDERWPSRGHSVGDRRRRADANLSGGRTNPVESACNFSLSIRWRYRRARDRQTSGSLSAAQPDAPAGYGRSDE